jgi:hypothetical protein
VRFPSSGFPAQDEAAGAVNDIETPRVE